MSFTWQKGQTGRGVSECGIDAKTTTPPKPYTEGTLVADMKGAARFIADPKLRESLKEADGIGTPATRASMIEKLKDVGAIRIESGKGKKQEGDGGYIRSTPAGQQIISMLPPMLTDPGTTALWEQMLGHISRGELPVDQFMRRQEDATRSLVTQALATKPNIPQGQSIPCSEAGCSGGGALVKRKGPHGEYWACSNSPDCKNKFNDVKGKPVLRTPSAPVEALAGDGEDCPKCKEGKLQTRVVNNPKSKANGKSFLSCNRYPKCDYSQWPK